MELKKSASFEKKLQTVREAKSKEAAAEFRMETLMDQAVLMKLIERSLIENPKITKEQLFQRVNKSDKIIDQQTTKEFINRLLQSREEAQSAIEHALKIKKLDPQLENKTEEEALGIIIFRLIQQDGNPRKRTNEPRKTIIAKLDFPLSLTILVDDPNDFAFIDRYTNMGGFYLDELSYEDSDKTCPVIAVLSKAGSNRNMIEHEKAHALQENFIQSLTETKKTILWVKYLAEDPPDENYIAYKEAKQKLNSLTSEDAEIPTKKRELEQDLSIQKEKIVSFLMSEAKDELLADYYATHTFNHLESILEKEDLYDYILDDIKAPKDSEDYIEFWNEYEKILKEQVESAKKLTDYYRAYGLEERLFLLHGILMQIPLNKWKETLEKTPFFEEMERLNKLGIEYLKIKNSLVKKHSKEAKKVEAYQKLYKRTMIRQNKPFLKDIAECEAVFNR